MKCDNGFYAQNFVPNLGLTEGRGFVQAPLQSICLSLTKPRRATYDEHVESEENKPPFHNSVESHAVIPHNISGCFAALYSLLEYTYRHRSSLSDDPGPGSQTCMYLAKDLSAVSGGRHGGGTLGLYS